MTHDGFSNGSNLFLCTTVDTNDQRMTPVTKQVKLGENVPWRNITL